MHETDIVVIGAGAAGVAAARRLHDQRIATVLLEARDASAGAPGRIGQASLRSISAAAGCIRPTRTNGARSRPGSASRSTIRRRRGRVRR